MDERSGGLPLPSALQQVALLEPQLAERLAEDFRRLTRVSEALAWAHSKLPAVLQAPSEGDRLRRLVDIARELTDAPEVWAVTWEGALHTGQASFRALAGDTAALAAPSALSQSIIATVSQSGRPSWTDDATADARFRAAESVQAFQLRSVGCLPLGPRGVLYLHDGTQPGRFTVHDRLRLSALCAALSPLLAHTPPEHEAAPLPAEPAPPVPGLVGDTAEMHTLFRAVHAFAPMPWPVLVLGETGTGKEAVSRALHALSPRRGEPFVAINCGAIVESLAESLLFGHERGAFTGAVRRSGGLVEEVGRGTLFLDEVGELPPSVQVKLLRLLQEGAYSRVGSTSEQRFEGRVIAATHRPLDDARRRGGFREDLYFRLAAAVVRVPPLRARRADLPALARHLLDRAAAALPGALALSLSADADRWLRDQPWPGNVRELENTLRAGIARAMARDSAALTASDLSGRVSAPPPTPSPTPTPTTDAIDPSLDLRAATTLFQKQRVQRALDACDGNKSEAARLLGVSRQWLHRLTQKWEEEQTP